MSYYFIRVHLRYRPYIRLPGYKFFSSKPLKNKEIGKDWKGVVGLEIHAQISSASKLFSGAGTDFCAPVNTNVSLFDAAIPGTLPVLNRRCIEAGVLTALALSCTINPVSLFDRKHYFYADLPAGYQITQQRLPLAHSGILNFHVSIPGVQERPYSKEAPEKSLVDLNRAGIPLMELVFEPDLENGEEAAALVKELVNILQRLQTCSCKMEEGALRVDANVSVHKKYDPLGVRTEVKNIGSIRGVAHAIEYEIKRQISTLESGGVIVNETRAWDDESRQTIPMRDKEQKQDYRYMPEPNLPPLRLIVDPKDRRQSTKDLINVNYLRNKIPELPAETRERLIYKFGIPSETAIILVNENILLEHFNEIINGKTARDPKLTSNILINELLAVFNKNKLSVNSSSLSSQSLGEIVDLLQNRKINVASARKLIQEVVAGNPESPSKLVEVYEMHQITDSSEIDRLCTEIIEQNPKLVEQFLIGKSKVFNSLVGKVAKATNNRANMERVVDILSNKLKVMKTLNKEATR
ncbi:Glutamyl-tRNA(Gln) amidotransferase subunit B [Blattella germanica]|nr:Glutamyl-tRNA(Gln) amidotransferase subunit B [Blattella germanica]